MAKTTIQNKPGVDPIPEDVIAQDIQTIAAGMRRLQSGRLNRRCILVLIQAATDNMPQRDIAKVLDAVAVLDTTYLNPVKK